jgi:hypothetical protein
MESQKSLVTEVVGHRKIYISAKNKVKIKKLAKQMIIVFSLVWVATSPK